MKPRAPDCLYPEHTKLRADESRRETAQEFIDWLQSQRFVICASVPVGLHHRYLPIESSEATLIAMFLGIDEAKLEAEKRDMLDALAKPRVRRGRKKP